MRTVAFIPLRGGGRRVGLIDGLDKERADLGGIPLMAWTILAALESGVFEDVVAVVAPDEHAEIAQRYGASIPARRPEATTRDDSPDIEWVVWALDLLREEKYDAFSILRVTSPFRTAAHIVAARDRFLLSPGVHSLRSVTPSRQDIAKTWVVSHGLLMPVLPFGSSPPWHSRPSQLNPQTYVQTAGIEIAWTKTVEDTQTISGSAVAPFILTGLAALDINTRDDFEHARFAVESGLVTMPEGLL